jgi:predicted glycoside hydrolase/deacetylase ChbG (UPF0249 family)
VILIKRLIINADDFGLHESINDGIFQGYSAGCVTSATIVAGGDAFSHAVRISQCCPNLSIGIHLTLVGLRPVARGDVSSLLTPDGNFFSSHAGFIRRYLKGAISRQHIETELHCQLQKVAGSGIRISHVDSHQHLHALPGFPKIIGRLAKEFHIARIRIPAEPFWFFDTPHSPRRTLERTALTGCALWARQQYLAQGLYGPENFFGMLSGGRMSQSSLQAILARLPEGTSEIMVHPGLDNEALNHQYHWGYHWREELEALQSPETLRLIQTKRIHLVSYRDI